MKVHELTKRLENLDPDLEIIFYTEDEALVREGHHFTIFDAMGIDITDAELTRVDGVPSLKLGATEASMKIATIEITSIF
jgi:hypothetical protein